MPVFTPIPHDEFAALVRTLANALMAGDWRPDFIIGIGRGGLAPGVYLSHATGLATLSVDYSSKVEDFSEAPLDRLAARTREGETLLFLDDINDTGGTIARLRARLAAKGAVMDHVRFATLLDNIRSGQRVEYAARTIDRAVTKDWFIFPWEAMAPDSVIAQDAAEVPERTA
ncbi:MULTISPECIES: phosphoribosyltransferase [unclassified Sphingomonas]|uniref:phosphoribosyltransferase n=1 Tax=unclassified Sphingomonas TaxID=196159 RepID=UPI000835C25A|nr:MULTISPECIES: phosphoribosyltransferase family protein [unclassified Sphingomonas]MCH4891820.1 phosphoribosyltransferase [Sphingomonas sp. SFZ2018-12]